MFVLNGIFSCYKYVFGADNQKVFLVDLRIMLLKFWIRQRKQKNRIYFDQSVYHIRIIAPKKKIASHDMKQTDSSIIMHYQECVRA